MRGRRRVASCRWPAGVPAEPRPVLAEYTAEGALAPILMVRDGALKLIWSEADPPLLFDLDRRSARAAQRGRGSRLRGTCSAGWSKSVRHELGSGRPATAPSASQPARTPLHLAGAHDRPAYQLGLPAPHRRVATLLAQYPGHGRDGSRPPLATGEPGAVTLDGQLAAGYRRHRLRRPAPRSDTGRGDQGGAAAGDARRRFQTTCRRRRDPRASWCARTSTDRARLPELCRGIDTVVHAAALMPGRQEHGAEAYRRMNLDAALHLAHAAAGAGVRRFVFVSSTAAMGAPYRPRSGRDHGLPAHQPL